MFVRKEGCCIGEYGASGTIGNGAEYGKIGNSKKSIVPGAIG